MRRRLIAGLLVWLPILATYVIIRFIIELLDQTLALLPHQYQPEQLFGHSIPGLGLLFTLIILFVTGLLVTNFVGHRVVALWEKILSRIPLIRSIHSAVKQVTHALVQPQGAAFRKVLLIEYPRRGVWSIAFQTSSNFNHPQSDADMLTAFVPTTPNPTSGFLTVIPKKDVVELDIGIEEALRMVISLGVVMPEKMKRQPNADELPLAKINGQM